MTQLFRVHKRVNKSLLSQKHIAIFGAGSVGGYCAQALAHLVGRLTIIDPEALSIANVERHRAGKSFVGQYKAEALSQIITEHYGLDQGVITPLTSYGQEVLGELEDVDLVIEATVDPELRYDVNLWAQRFDVPVIYTGVYAGGSGWQTAVLPDPNQVCYMCLELSRTKPKRTKQDLGDYGAPAFVDEKDQLHSASGLASAVMAAASATAEQAIDVLQGDLTESTLFRTTYRVRDFMVLTDEDSLHAADLSIQLLQLLGIDLFEVAKGSDGRFTLRQKPGSIPHNIRQASGCLFHSASQEDA